jgi:hypothetical protein
VANKRTKRATQARIDDRFGAEGVDERVSRFRLKEVLFMAHFLAADGLMGVVTALNPKPRLN